MTNLLLSYKPTNKISSMPCQIPSILNQTHFNLTSLVVTTPHYPLSLFPMHLHHIYYSSTSQISISKDLLSLNSIHLTSTLLNMILD